MKVTINDVAKIANVSPSTVSRVIAGNARISEETRNKVLKIMKELNYHPNIIARSLANKSTKIIGVIVPGTTEKAFQHPFLPEILRGIASAASKSKYKILISSATSINEEKETIDELVNGAITEGIILLASRVKDPCIKEMMKLKFPFVVVGRPSEEDKINWVDNNNLAISYELTKHFLDQGHKEIAFLGFSKDHMVTVDRLEGYKKALEDYNITLQPHLVVEGEFIDDTGYNLAKKLSESGSMPSAVIACDDLLAFGVIKYLNEKGLRVPQDVAVAGFNNVPLSDYFVPSLTSVEVNAFNLGYQAFQLLMNNISSNLTSINRSIVSARLVIRESSLFKKSF